MFRSEYHYFIAKQIIKHKYYDRKYRLYFKPEIQPFINEKWFPKYVDLVTKELPKDFYKKEELVKMMMQFVN